MSDEIKEPPLFVGEPEHCALCGKPGHTHDDHWAYVELGDKDIAGMLASYERELERRTRWADDQINELIHENRVMRAYIRRSDEAIRTVADAIEKRFPSDCGDGDDLRGWLRRMHVRRVRGNPKETP